MIDVYNIKMNSSRTSDLSYALSYTMSINVDCDICKSRHNHQVLAFYYQSYNSTYICKSCIREMTKLDMGNIPTTDRQILYEIERNLYQLKELGLLNNLNQVEATIYRIREGQRHRERMCGIRKKKNLPLDGLFELQDSIEEIKEKINDGEYLNLNNIARKIYDII